MIRKALIAATFAAALSGCVSLGPKVPDTLLSLTATRTAAAEIGRAHV